MKNYDLDKLRNDLDCIEVAEILGLDVIKKGSSFYIECPEHFDRMGKYDENIGNCQITSIKYECYSCGASGSVFDLIKHTLNISIYKAFEYAAKLYGNEYFYLTLTDNKEMDSFFPLNSNELAMIRLRHIRKNIKNIINASIVDEEESMIKNKNPFDFMKDEWLYFNPDETVRFSLQDLYDTDKEAFSFLIKNKLAEAKANINIVKRELDRNSPFYEAEKYFEKITDELIYKLLGALNNQYLELELLQYKLIPFLN